MLRKILKWTFFSIVFIIAGVAVATMFRQHLTYDAPYPAIKASTDTMVINKGKHIAMVTKGCVHCHSPVNNVDSVLKKGEVPLLSGNKMFETLFGTFSHPTLHPMLKLVLVT